MNDSRIFRVAAAVFIGVAAYSLGRFHNSEPSPPEVEAVEDAPAETETPTEIPAPTGSEESEEPQQLSPAERVLREIADVAEAARTVSHPDARTYAFFENLDLDEVEIVAGYLEEMPAGNEQDVLFVMAMRRWAQLDGPAALDRANAFPALGTRTRARTAVYGEWASHDSEAALLRAVDEPEPDLMAAAVKAVVAGAATMDPRDALTLWNIAPKKFVDSIPGKEALEQLVESAYGTGRGDEVRALIRGLPSGDVKTLLANGLASNWARHNPDEAYAWLTSTLPSGEERDAVIDNMFAAMAFNDPAMAAAWAARRPEMDKQPVFIAAAIAHWARMDLAGAEIWVNEQPEGSYLDGASFALAKHFLESGEMKHSFAWIRRVREDRDRAELLVRLGRRWSDEEPREFRRFLEEPSLSPIEVKMLLSGVDPST